MKETDGECECKNKDWQYECNDKEWKYKKWRHGRRGGENWGAIYCLGMIGVAVYYVQQVHGFWPVILAVLKAFVWPAFLLYHVFQMLHM